jgi:predicted ribonuclease YlaK
MKNVFYHYQGTVLNSFNLVAEEDGGQSKKNDDLILDACISLCREKEQQQQQQQPQAGMRVVQRDVILLTEDRNLRLKAHATADVPVTSVNDFLKWLFGPSSLGPSASPDTAAD